MSDDVQDIVARFWKEIFTEGNVEAIDEVLSRDFVLHDLATKQDFTRDKLKARLSDTLAAIPDLEAIIEDEMTAEGGRVVTRVTLRAPRPRLPLPATPAPSPREGFEFTLTGRSGEHRFKLHISPAGIATSATEAGPDSYASTDMGTGMGTGMAAESAAPKEAPITPYAASFERVAISGIAISRMTPDGKIGETWFLWEEMRARIELEPMDIEWRWPPWWR